MVTWPKNAGDTPVGLAVWRPSFPVRKMPERFYRKLKWLRDSRLDNDQLNRILNKNAAEFFHLDV